MENDLKTEEPLNLIKQETNHLLTEQYQQTSCKEVVEDDATFSSNTTNSAMSCNVGNSTSTLTDNNENLGTTVKHFTKAEPISSVNQVDSECNGLQYPIINNNLPTPSTTNLRRSQRKPANNPTRYSPDSFITTINNKSKSKRNSSSTTKSATTTTSLKVTVVATTNDAANNNSTTPVEVEVVDSPVVDLSAKISEVNGFKNEIITPIKRLVPKKTKKTIVKQKPTKFPSTFNGVRKTPTTTNGINNTRPISVYSKKKSTRERYFNNPYTQTFHDTLTVGNQTYKIGDCVQLATKYKSKKIGRINAIYTEIPVKAAKGSKKCPKNPKVPNDPTIKKILISCYYNSEKHPFSNNCQFVKHELFATRRTKVYYENEILKKCYVVGVTQYNRIKAMKKRVSLEELGQLLPTTFKPSFLLPHFNSDIEIAPTNIKSKFLYFCRSIINVSNLSINPHGFKY